MWEFVIQTDHLIQAGWPDVVLINKKEKKKNLTSNGFCRSGGPLGENKGKQKERQKLWILSNILQQRKKKKTVDQEGDRDANCCWCDGNGFHSLWKGLTEMEVRGKIEIIQQEETCQFWCKKVLKVDQRRT